MIIPRILLISIRKRLFDVPDERKIHTQAIPRLGGVSFFPTILFAYALVFAVRVLGGELQIEWDENTGEIFMTGPAETVFEGQV